MRQPLSGVCLLVTGMAAASCASAPPKASPLDLATADALVAEGCYDCLVEARDLYATAAIGRNRPVVLPRLFETTVLLGLRNKELALDATKPLAEATAIAAELPATYTGAEYLAIASAVLPDVQGTPHREIAAIRRPSARQLVKWTTDLATGDASSLFRRYLSASLDCTFWQVNAADATVAAAPSAAPAPEAAPLLAFRRANCQTVDQVMLEGLVEAHPRFLEAGVMTGRVRSLTPTSLEIANARKWLTASLEKWPQSPVVTYALGSLNQTVGDCRAAIGFYDDTIRLKPVHEDAHLGRLMCLSYTRQYDPAIAEATGMIDARMNVGEALYWRAWNKREQGQLKEARLDSDRMKPLLRHDRSFLLAGQIEHDLDDLAIADTDLRNAVRLSGGKNCVAHWYIALVQLKKQAWTPTAEGFVGAMKCYESALAETRVFLERMRIATNVDETFRAAQIAGFEAAIRDDESQVSASAFNAAANYARANNREKALEYCDLAAKDPQRAAQAGELRAMIVKR
jgi:hypothetical protein